jgi:hypothetical protein
MSGMNKAPRRITAGLVGFVAILTLVWGPGSSVGTPAFGGPASSGAALVATQDRVSAPLKPDWVDDMLDARATALRALLDARDLLPAQSRPLSAITRMDGADRVSAPLKPDWVEALLDARATALRALLDARDLQLAGLRSR